jgi:hypothetical protein
MRYLYVAEMRIRPTGAIGAFGDVKFPVVLPDPTATASQVADSWRDLIGDDFESVAIVSVNGQPTLGVGCEHVFDGEEV